MTFGDSSTPSCTPTVRRNGRTRSDGLTTAIGRSNFWHWSCANERPRRSIECSAVSGSSMRRGRCFQHTLATLSDSARVRANAAEYIERALSPSLRELVLPLLPGARRGERLELAEKRYGLRPMSAHESLALLVESDDLWLRTVPSMWWAFAARGHLLPQVEANLESADARVSETAAWARLALAVN